MNLHNITFVDINGVTVDGASFKGKKVLFVNTASECGFTPQFEQLEELYQAFKDESFVVVGIPSNDFGAQDPGDNSEIASFCQKNYGVTFPMMKKVNVIGDNQHEFFKWISKETGSEVKWNFEKFLIDENGDFVKSLNSDITPLDFGVIDWISVV